MWDSQKRERFRMLRERTGPLNAAEHAELNAMTHELESNEATCIDGATNRMRQEREVVEVQNRSLEALAVRQQAFIERLECAQEPFGLDFLPDGSVGLVESGGIPRLRTSTEK